MSKKKKEDWVDLKFNEVSPRCLECNAYYQKRDHSHCCKKAKEKTGLVLIFPETLDVCSQEDLFEAKR